MVVAAKGCSSSRLVLVACLPLLRVLEKQNGSQLLNSISVAELRNRHKETVPRGHLVYRQKPTADARGHACGHILIYMHFRTGSHAILGEGPVRAPGLTTDLTAVDKVVSIWPAWEVASPSSQISALFQEIKNTAWYHHLESAADPWSRFLSPTAGSVVPKPLWSHHCPVCSLSPGIRFL